MAKKAIADIESRTKKLLNDRTTELEDIKGLLAEAGQQQAAACDMMNKATEAGNVKEYQKAKGAYKDAADAIEMYTKRLDALENKPLISQGEYEKGVAQIMAALNDVSAEAKKQIVNHMEQVRIIAAETSAEINEGNNVLHRWQHEAYRDDAKTTLSNGSRVYSGTQKKQYKDFSVVQFAEYALESTYYKTISGR